jgi:apolipoprotein N-acyltransferase
MLAGALSVLAMAPFFASPVLFLTLPVLVWLIDGAGPYPRPVALPGLGPGRAAWRAALSGWCFGFGYFVVGLYWIGEAFLVEAETFLWLLPFAVTLLPAGLALFFALACGLARLAWSGGLARILVLAVALSLAEWLRGHILTGFPWNTLGYALASPLPLMQMASVLGIYGLTLWTIVVFAAPLTLWAESGPRPRLPALALALSAALIPLLVLAAGGIFVLKRQPVAVDDSVRIRIVQASIPQREKWLQDKQAANFTLQLDLSRRDPAGRQDDLAGVTHVVWPEAAMPFLPLDSPQALAAIAALLPAQTHLISGALRVQRPPPGASTPRQAFNSLMVFGPGGRLAAVYDKIHLVPFGEYLPFQSTLESIGLEQLTRMRGGFAAGAAPRPLLSIPGLPRVGALVCYEAIFPTEVVQGIERPGLLVNITNDGWFGDSIGPHQHLHQARVRAVEQGLPLIRAANNGISAVVDAQGRILAQLPLNARGVIDSGLPRIGAPTLYVRYGEAIFAGLVLMFLAWATVLRRRR